MRHGSGAVAWLPQLDCYVVGGLVRCGDLLPHAVLDEDVRGHVTGMGYGWRDLRELPRRGKCDGCVHRVVEGVDDVVRRAGMLGVRAEDL